MVVNKTLYSPTKLKVTIMSIQKTISITLDISESCEDYTSISEDDINLYISKAVDSFKCSIEDGILISGGVDVHLENWSVTDSSIAPILAYNVSEDHFKASAKRLQKQITDISTNVIGHAKSQQILSQSLYSKPFEEIKNTILKGDFNKYDDFEVNIINSLKENIVNNHQVIIIDLGGEYVLFVNGEFVTATFKGMDNEISFGVLYEQAERFSNNYNTRVEEAFLDINDYFDGEFEYDDLKVLFNVEGILNSKDFELINKLENVQVVMIDNNSYQYALNGNWRSEFSSDNESLEDAVESHIIWTPEDDTHEFFFSIKDLMMSQKIGENTWKVNDNGASFQIEILK